ncbi:response regulator [Calothrix sp. 336/3]|uniref:response regulator n=1 Tax=Calothrix sp. 336/3 TaxID=1337936 RepID=UPI0004E34C98|nr:response regulator [Calothrix sp. 336/3]AKG24266.1 chemotaxis protein CheY [Calothrix sp. 336/3]
MKILPINRYRFYQALQPLTLLKKVSSKSTSGCLQVFTASASWSIYIQDGRLIYASHIDKMFEILYRNLHDLSEKVPTLPTGIREQLRAIFETGIDHQAIPNPDYLAICWLVNQKLLTVNQAGILIEQLAVETLESFLRVREGSYEFTTESFLDEMPKFCYLDVRLLVEQSLQRMARQRQKTANNNSHQQSNPSAPLRAKFPQISYPSAQSPPETAVKDKTAKIRADIKKVRKTEETAQYTIICIDDNPTVIKAITYFLDDQLFSVVGISDPLKALMQMIRLKPDIILLDIEMPNLDGYELCSLLRKHNHFKGTPIIMVTGRTGFIDRARAKIVRASGYLSKPFTQAELIKVIFQNLQS